MAKVKNGKLHGRIGNTIHRVFRGQEIVQSYPRSLKPRGQTLTENNLFGECSKMNASIYRLIKDFALRNFDYSFSWEIMALLKRNFFQKQSNTNSNRADWKKIEEATCLAINKGVLLEDVLFELPDSTLANGKLRLFFPAHTKIEHALLMKDVVCTEYSFTVIHYDFYLKLAEISHVINSGRIYTSRGFPEQVYEIELSSEEREIKDGLIIVCFGLRFFASSISYGYLNSKEINPTAILGMWYKA